MAEERGPPLIPTHPWITKAVDAWPAVATEAVEFFFEGAKRVTLIVAIRIAATSSKSAALGDFAAVAVWMLGLWISLRLGAPLRAWIWNQTLDERRDPKNQALALMGILALCSVGIGIAAMLTFVITDLQLVAHISPSVR
jgi:hypothetical protein